MFGLFPALCSGLLLALLRVLWIPAILNAKNVLLMSSTSGQRTVSLVPESQFANDEFGDLSLRACGFIPFHVPKFPCWFASTFINHIRRVMAFGSLNCFKKCRYKIPCNFYKANVCTYVWFNSFVLINLQWSISCLKDKSRVYVFWVSCPFNFTCTLFSSLFKIITWPYHCFLSIPGMLLQYLNCFLS